MDRAGGNSIALHGNGLQELVGHCNKKGAGLTEKRVGLDIAGVCQGIDAGDTTFVWMQTEEIPADGLTKHLQEREA